MRRAIYTAITGEYDTLKDPQIITPGWEYICFTNNKNLRSDFWKVKLVNDSRLSNVKLARKIKILSHQYLKGYDLTIWHDASMVINCNLKSFTSVFHKKDITIMKHPHRGCIYEEARACIKMGKDKREVILKQIEKYRNEGYPEKNGLVGSGIIIRNNNSRVNALMNDWWSEVENFSHRDQLSFNYALNNHPEVNCRVIPFFITRTKFILKKHAPVSL